MSSSSTIPLALALGALTLAAPVASSQAPAPPAQAAAAASAAPAPESIMPVHQEPHHRQVFHYGTIRILDLQLPPNDSSLWHSHAWPVLYLTLASSTTRTQNLGSDWGPRGTGGGPGGAALANGGAPIPTVNLTYIDKPATHRIENVGTGLFRAVFVVNETKGDADTTQEAAGFTGKPEVTNNWFRAYRLTLAPGEKAAHTHRAPVVIFQATAGRGVANGPMRFDFTDPGEWAFYDTGVQHELQNTGDKPLQLIEVEVRRK
jgi:mannose-6-phosphate isomerase-like protein (cupin superfamily)